MQEHNKEETIAFNNPKTGKVEYIPKADLEKPEKYEIFINQKGVYFALTKEQAAKMRQQGSAMRGCFAVFIFVFLASMIGGITFMAIDQYKKNKKHPNIISSIYDEDKRLIITDIYTHEERLISYDGYGTTKDIQEFQNRIKHSKIGDTVMLISPYYKKRIKFDLGAKSNLKNWLVFNKDSIIARTKAEKLKQDLDSIENIKQNQR